MKQVNGTNITSLLVALHAARVDAFLPKLANEDKQVLCLPTRCRRHFFQQQVSTQPSFSTTQRLFQSPTSWEDLAEEWKARNRDDDNTSVSALQTRQVAAPNPFGIAPVSVSSAPTQELAQPTTTTVGLEKDIMEAWKEFDQEIMTMQREATEAMEGLERMEAEMDHVAAELRVKDENYVLQIRDIQSRGDSVAADLRHELDTLSKEFDAYRIRTETQRQSFHRDAESKQQELRSQIDSLQDKLQDQIKQLELQRTQSANLQKEKMRLDEDLQRQCDETAASIKEWEARVRDIENIRARERQDFQTRLQEIQDEASRRLESTMQQFASEKQQIERDYTNRLQKVSEDLRTTSAKLAEAQKIIDEKQKYIATLEPAVTNLDDWTQESWFQLNRLQDAVGLPVTPLNEKGEIPGVETLEREAQNLIEHLRTRERYFEDAIFDIQTEMQNKDREMKQELSQLENEYDEYQQDMTRNLDDSREGAALAKLKMQEKLDELGAELEIQRSLFQEETQRAKEFMEAKDVVNLELKELKKEASYVIDELENQLAFEQDARRKESEKAKEALERVGEESMENINKVIAQGRVRFQAKEDELSTRVFETEKELRLSKLTSSIFLSVAITSVAVAGLSIQSMRSDAAKNPSAPKTANAAIEQTNQRFSIQENKKVSSPPKFSLPSEVWSPVRPRRKEATLLKPIETVAQSKESQMQPNGNAPTEPSAAVEKENKIDTSTRKNFFYAIKEDGTEPPKEDFAPTPPNSVSIQEELKPSATIDGSTASLPEVNLRKVFGIQGEETGSSNDLTNIQISQKREQSAASQEEASTPPPTKTRAAFPTSDAKGKTYFAIKEEVVGPSLEKADEGEKASSNLAKEPVEPVKSPDIPPGPSRAYFAIKEEGMIRGQAVRQMAPANPEPRADTFTSKETAEPSRSLSTVDDGDQMIDWETLTNRWLEEVKDIQSGNAQARKLPSLDPPDTMKTTKTGTEILDNTLLQQALAPPTPNDPFGRTDSR